MSKRPPLILGSTSSYRRELLQRLRLPFEVESPDVDETALAGEAPAALAQRLALAKAEAVSARHPDAVVIGSDQVAELDGAAIGKPGTHERVTVRFRALSDAEIEHYLRIEQPYDCAGSAKCETLGIALLEAIESDDPTALVGLPLIRTSALLREAGIDALAPPVGR
jgi:septum formation protein